MQVSVGDQHSVVVRLGHIIIICKEINTFIQQGCIKLTKSNFYKVTKIYISNKCCYFELSTKRILEKCI